MEELHKLLLKSKKFINWKKPPEKMRPMNPALSVVEEHSRHNN